MLSTRARLGLRVQEVVSQAFVLLTYHSLAAWMRCRRYRIPDLRSTRAEFAALVLERRGPLLVCANHLTLIDSLIIQWALAPGWRLFVRPDWFFWNLPDKYNMSVNPFLRVLGYFGKCVLVHRKGPPEEARRALDKVAFLMARGQSVLVFPEGGRSRVGRVETTNFMYGVGRMLQETPTARVVCVFARGLGQREYSNFPRRGETFFVRMERLAPTTAFHGMRADRDLATQIVRHLSAMEQEYLENTILDR
ncbi:MAG TPA: lysophospholipid acyltransferase family protein [Vicinamibacterales bacterium]